MTAAGTVYLQLQRVARDRKRPADEIFTLYGLERFLARLADTSFAEDFCLKGGVLLSAHSLRRPTRDVDIQALDFQLDVDHVTVLQRGTTSTRWRDLLDVAILSDRFQFDVADLREATMRVAGHRILEVRPLRAVMYGYGATGQAKWAAWRRKLKVEDMCEQDLDAQVERVLTFIEPVFDGSAEDHHRWSPDARVWS